MLSYMLPVEDKSASSSPSARNLNLSLNLNATASPGAGTGANMGGIAAGPMTNGNSLDPSCDESAQLISSERVNNLKNAPRDLKLDNGIIKMSQTHHKPPLPTQNGDHDPAGATTEDSSCADTDSKSAPSNNKKSTGKLNKTGTKNVTLKRVSFGSSKGSMVETLVFETPTPLPEHAEREFGFPAENYSAITTQHYNSGGVIGGGGGGSMFGNNVCKMINNNNYNHSNNNNSSCLDDSGIEMQEELERSKVRVTFFQSSKPQQVSPPESYINYADSSLPLLSDSFIADTSTLSESTMTAATATQPTYDRQISTESGWDNPFRPGGDLSREADEIVNMIKGGKPITPTGDPNHSIANGNAQKDTGNHAIENGQAVVDGATKKEVSHVQTSIPAQNGTKSPQQNSTALAGNKANGDAKNPTAPQTQVSNQVIPGPISASHVVIEDKKKKKCTCCVIQ